MNGDSDDLQELRNEIKRLLAAALNSDAKHEAEMQRRDDMHLAETERRDELHIAELGRRDRLHIDEMALVAAAIESRDIIGQAKGVIMVTVGCSADEAFQLVKTQSQHENRKVVEVAAEIAGRAERKDISGSSESNL
jgi:ANTAR domain